MCRLECEIRSDGIFGKPTPSGRNRNSENEISVP